MYPDPYLNARISKWDMINILVAHARCASHWGWIDEMKRQIDVYVNVMSFRPRETLHL